MFKVCEMTALCIRSRIFPPRAPKSSLIASSTSVDHPPKTSMMMLYCWKSYPGNCCLSSHWREPQLMVFSSCFFSQFSVHGQLISTARNVFFSWSINLASTLFCCSTLLAHLLQRLVYLNMLGPRVNRRWVLERPGNTTVALYLRLEALLAFPKIVLILRTEGYFRPFFHRVYKGCH